jgi:integrase
MVAQIRTQSNAGLPVSIMHDHNNGGSAFVRNHDTGEIMRYDQAAFELEPMSLPLDRNPALIYLAGLSAGSRRTMREALDRIADVAKGGSCNHTTSQAETGRHLSMGELAALMGACADSTKAGARDAAVIAVGYACGLRRSELAGLELEHFDRDKEALTIHGKRNRVRIVYVSNGALDALMGWIEVRGQDPGPLFLRIRRGDHIGDAGITAQAVYNILERRREEAKVQPFTPHDLRRTFAGELLDAGADIATVQQLMGHANVQTTAGYDRRGAEAKRKAVALLHVPYQKPEKSALRAILLKVTSRRD